MSEAPLDPRLGWELPPLGEMEVSARLSPILGRVVAPNPSHMTLDGTNTYVVSQPGSGVAFVVDPGPDDATHLERVRKVVEGVDAECAAILVTHHHSDHAEAAEAWSGSLGGRIAASSAEVAGPGGRVLAPGDSIRAGGMEVGVVATPGHTADHVCFRLPDGGILAGDHVLGRGTSVISWPEGDLAAYLSSLRQIHDLGPDVLYPGHGPELAEDPSAVIDFYLQHRAWREEQVVTAIEKEPLLASDPARLVGQIYAEVDPRMWPVAELSTRACLVKLYAEGRLPAGSSLPFDAALPDGGGGDISHLHR